MSAMTTANAANARQANDLVTQVRDAAHKSDEGLQRLNGAMSGINESSGQIQKIIKVIEEIAFQTNLLALNAAVEAARAGEHGKGFAVVADEVRNLAQRAAEAAGETTALIEESVGRAREGNKVAEEFGGALAGIIENVAQASELVSAINVASYEQNDGVTQIGNAVSEIERVTASISESARDSATAVDELSTQAGAIASSTEMLAELIGVGGRKAGAGASTGAAGTTAQPPETDTPPDSPAHASSTPETGANEFCHGATPDSSVAFDTDQEVPPGRDF
jgi:methyl-accepting chemotaxis protein